MLGEQCGRGGAFRLARRPTVPPATCAPTYHHGVSSAGYAAAALGGAVLGWLVCFLANRRSEPQQPPQPTGEPSLEQEVLRLSTTGYLVMSQSGRPLLSNGRATELGVLRVGIVDPLILQAAARAAVSGEPVDVELHPVSVTASLAAPRVAPIAVLAVVRVIDEGRILVSATDESAALADGGRPPRLRRECLA